jgi:hypothetical protein
MAPKKYLSIEDKLHEAQIALDNTLANHTIASAVAFYGYDEEKLAKGKALYSQALRAHRKQMAEYGEKYEATRALHDAWEKADTVFRNAYRVARIAMRNRTKAWSALGLSKGRQRSLGKWLDLASAFYSNLLSDLELRIEMERFAYDYDRLIAEQKLVKSVEDAAEMQETEEGEAVLATIDRNASIAELDEWMRDYIDIAEIALEHRPKELEKLGIAAA